METDYDCRRATHNTNYRENFFFCNCNKHTTRERTAHCNHLEQQFFLQSYLNIHGTNSKWFSSSHRLPHHLHLFLQLKYPTLFYEALEWTVMMIKDESKVFALASPAPQKNDLTPPQGGDILLWITGVIYRPLLVRLCFGSPHLSSFSGLWRRLKMTKIRTYPRGQFFFVCNIYGHHLYSPPCLLVQIVDLSQRERQPIKHMMSKTILAQSTGNKAASFKYVLTVNQMGFKFKSRCTVTWICPFVCIALFDPWVCVKLRSLCSSVALEGMF